MRYLGAVQPYGTGVVDLQNEHVACGSESAPDDVGSRRLAGAGELRSRHGVAAGGKDELDLVASIGCEGVWGKDESTFAGGDISDTDVSGVEASRILLMGPSSVQGGQRPTRRGLSKAAQIY